MSAKTLIIFGAAILLTACAQPLPMVTHEEPPADTAAEIKLAEAAASINQSLVQLAEVEKAVNPGAKIPPPPNPVSIRMEKLASVNWTGPVEPLIRKIAAVSGYKVRVLGKQPAIPALVSISAQNIPLADILRDATFQVQKKANIVLYPQSSVIEIRYLGN